MIPILRSFRFTVLIQGKANSNEEAVELVREVLEELAKSDLKDKIQLSDVEVISMN